MGIMWAALQASTIRSDCSHYIDTVSPSHARYFTSASSVINAIDPCMNPMCPYTTPILPHPQHCRPQAVPSGRWETLNAS